MQKEIHMASFFLVVAGAINWGLFGLFGWDLVDMFLSSIPMLKMLVYILIGLSGVYLLFTHKSDCKICSKK